MAKNKTKAGPAWSPMVQYVFDQARQGRSAKTNVLDSRSRDVSNGLEAMLVQSLKAREHGDAGSTLLPVKHRHEGAEVMVQNGALLVELIQDLLTEVEALRAAVIGLQREAGSKENPYARAYLETTLLTHNSAGPTRGFDKLLDLFYPNETDSEDRNWREMIMLRRLGLSQEDLERFKQDAKRVEANT